MTLRALSLAARIARASAIATPSMSPSRFRFGRDHVAPSALGATADLQVLQLAHGEIPDLRRAAPPQPNAATALQIPIATPVVRCSRSSRHQPTLDLNSRLA
jgi:hypothetical protein